MEILLKYVMGGGPPDRAISTTLPAGLQVCPGCPVYMKKAPREEGAFRFSLVHAC